MQKTPHCYKAQILDHSGVRRGGFFALALSSGTVKCFFQPLFTKNYPHAPLSKSWNVIVGYNDCNCSMHLSKFSALAQFRPQPTSISKKRGQHCLFPHNLKHCVNLSPISKNNVSRPHKKFLRTSQLGQPI